MSNHVTDEERKRRIYMVYECIIDGMSTRECAKFLTDNYFSISNATVKDYIDRMKKFDKEKYNKMVKIVQDHAPKTVTNSEEVRTRVKDVAVLLMGGYTFEEIAKILKISVFTAYRDFTVRLKKVSTKEARDILGITDEEIKKIELSLKERSMENLNNGKTRK